MPQATDTRYMQHALRLASRGLGCVWPNPSVGALAIKDGVIIGAGVTARGGRPHAEALALAQAGVQANGATLYVTLEPCSHHGQTPPCAEAIIKAGIKRVVAACTDPNPLVAGKGFAMLRAANIEITQGVCEEEARAMNEGFFLVQQRGRPFVTLKTATSLDGKITAGSKETREITGEESRRMVHALRARHDAILTGIGTVLADDPQLTSRLPGLKEDSPQRVVMDGSLRTPLDARILPAWIFTCEESLKAGHEKAKLLEKKGAKLFVVQQNAGKLLLPQTLAALAKKGITRLFVETGSRLAGEFMRQELVDRLYWFRAPSVIGEKGLPALQGYDESLMNPARRLKLQALERFGEDALEIYDREPV